MQSAETDKTGVKNWMSGVVEDRVVYYFAPSM
jgi:hypothetical protein